MPCFRPRFGIYTFPKKVHVYGGRCHSIHLVRSLLVKFACGLHKPRRVRRGPRTPSGRAAKKNLGVTICHNIKVCATGFVVFEMVC